MQTAGRMVAMSTSHLTAVDCQVPAHYLSLSRNQSARPPLPFLCEVAVNRQADLGLVDFIMPSCYLHCPHMSQHGQWDWQHGRRDLLYLDLALENVVRGAAERGSGAAGASASALVGPLLQNLVLSTGDNEELCYCLKAWQALPSSLRRGGYPSKEDALKVTTSEHIVRFSRTDACICHEVVHLAVNFT